MFANNVMDTRVKKKTSLRKRALLTSFPIRAIPETLCGHLDVTTASRHLKRNIKASSSSTDLSPLPKINQSWQAHCQGLAEKHGAQINLTLLEPSS